MKLDEIRKEIDNVDEELVALYKKRMMLSAEVAEYKKIITCQFSTLQEKEHCWQRSPKCREANLKNIQERFTALYLTSHAHISIKF